MTKRISVSVVAPSVLNVRLSSLHAFYMLMVNQITNAQSRVVRNRSFNSVFNFTMSVSIVSTFFLKA